MQKELKMWVDGEPFALVSDLTMDGERIAQEKEQKEKDHAESSGRQQGLEFSEGV